MEAELSGVQAAKGWEPAKLIGNNVDRFNICKGPNFKAGLNFIMITFLIQICVHCASRIP